MSTTQPATATTQSAMGGRSCRELPDHARLAGVLRDVVGQQNAGFGLNMWATIVNRDGEVCAVAFSGGNRGDQWPGSRVISAQKANTANAFSLPGLALSTANLYSAVQPGGSLYGLQFSNPVDTGVAYGGSADAFGQPNDPMAGKRIGGVNVFGGVLALYNTQGTLVGALGVSGDTSGKRSTPALQPRRGCALSAAGFQPQGRVAKFALARLAISLTYDLCPQAGASR